MAVLPYPENILVQLPGHLVYKCGMQLFQAGILTYPQAMALKWDDIFDFSPSELYGCEPIGKEDIHLHLKDGRVVSYKTLMDRLHNGQLKPS